MDRRRFLSSIALSPLAACRAPAPAALPPGSFLGPDFAFGHRLQKAPETPQGEAEQVGVLIVGGGIGGLSAAWWLRRNGFDDFLVAEMEAEAGGNSRGGANPVSAFPLGAHYLPLPTAECHSLRRMLADLGALHGDPDAQRPRYEESLLCAAPQERLFRFGHWQEGLMPEVGLTGREREQLQRFQARIAGFQQQRAGRKPFALPMARSALDDDLMALDRISFRDWLLREGFDSRPLHWYADYACRDDYGTPAARVSAWAGLHYFACRDGLAGNAAADVVLTAPEGNAWIARGLAAPLGSRLRTGVAVTRLEPRRGGWEAWLAPRAGGAVRKLHARKVIWAAPLFLAARVIGGLPEVARAHVRSIDYAPWLLVQLSLNSSPSEAAGAARAWDNVIYDSAALGFVVADHQRFHLSDAPSVWTWYQAFAAASDRKLLLEAPREHWARLALSDLSLAYPDLAEHVERIDCVRYGHAMARPLPGFLTAPGRAWFAAGEPGLQFAHADVSGFSLCEEAHARGVNAAERILAGLRGRRPDANVTF